MGDELSQKTLNRCRLGLESSMPGSEPVAEGGEASSQGRRVVCPKNCKCSCVRKVVNTEQAAIERTVVRARTDKAVLRRLK